MIVTKSVNNILAQADERGISIILGWTVPISKKDIIHYVSSYNTSPHVGFYEVNNLIVLTHHHAKITLTPEEYQAVKDLVEAAYTGLDPVYP